MTSNVVTIRNIVNNLIIVSQINVARKTNRYAHEMTESPMLFVNKQTFTYYILETFEFLRFTIISNGLLQSSRDLVSGRRWIHQLQTRTHALCVVYCVFGACPTSLPFENQKKHLANEKFLRGMDCIYKYNDRGPGEVEVFYS
jgi:hypothetical protein